MVHNDPNEESGMEVFISPCVSKPQNVGILTSMLVHGSNFLPCSLSYFSFFFPWS